MVDMSWILAIVLVSVTSGVPLNGMITHYEKLDFDTSDLKRDHTRVKRGTDADLRLNFKAFQREFRLILRRDPRVFSDDVVFESSEGPLVYDTSRMYTGIDQGLLGGRAHGLINNQGHFEGHILHVNETYYVESALRHFQSPQEFHSLIYRRSDVKYDFDQAMCNSDVLHHKLRSQHELNERGQHGGEYEPEVENHYAHGQEPDGVYRYIKEERSSRKKRGTIDPTKTICGLYLQADHLFYQKFGSDTDVVIDLLSSYVQAINPMFNRIDYDGDGSADNIGFLVKRIKVLTDPNAAGYKFPDPSYSVDKYLDIHSQENYDAFCLSIIFTYRDFDNGVLGLAWTAAAGMAGGVCEKYRTYKGVGKSLNSAIVTVLNYGQDVASAVTHTTLAHEIGHNFGSLHDPSNSATCSPGGNDGNYIMYAMATSGYQPNNVKFSSCSNDYIAPILASKARDTNDGCFEAPKSSLCGNRIVEGTEECDCGWEDECNENCCNPQTSNSSSGATPCKRKSGGCSPSQGPCCKSTCSLYTAGEKHECRSNASCVASADCDGTSVNCPAPQAEPNGTHCDDGRVCYLGECSGSVCLAHGLQSCQCAATSETDWSNPILCTLCCIYNGKCTKSEDIPSVTAAKSLPGSACNNFLGYCDVFHVCQKVDASGPLDRLKNFLLSGEIVQTMKEFLTKHWYIAVAVGVGLIIILAIVVKFCSKSHNPRNQVKPTKDREREMLEYRGERRNLQRY